ncbi:MAG: DUF362 domain-containing protein [Thermodesulfobacteriota bacterium]
MESVVYTREFASWSASVAPLVRGCGLLPRLADQQRLLIKPNLVEVLAPPITTPVALVAEIIREVRRSYPDLEIMVGEGCGSKDYDTFHVFDQLGYSEMGRELAVELIDLNEEEWREREVPQARRWPLIHLPRLVDEVFLLSVPVLKAHSLAGVTLTLKNMMGLLPPARYQQGGNWRKAAFHEDIHGSLIDLNRARCPDFTIIDGTIGMQQAHLWGPHCEPAKNTLAASPDPVAIDAWGADLLGFGWQAIEHIRALDGVLGQAAYELVAL